MKKPTLADYITRIPITVDCGQTVSFARSLMVEHGIHHLPVLRGDQVVGVLSQRDLLVLDAAGAEADEMLLEKAMVADPYVADIDCDLALVAREMAGRKIGSAVVVSDGRVIAMFTTNDALRALDDALG